MSAELGVRELALAGLLMLASGGVSIALRLKLERTLLTGAVRATLQLGALGYLLKLVFGLHHPLPIIGWCLMMSLLAAREVRRRSRRRYPGAGVVAWVSLGVTGGLLGVLTTRFLLQLEPWWSPRYLIPMLGMLLGNSLTAVTLGLDRCLALLDEQRDRVETLLAMGATRWEAARPIAREALRAAMIPSLNGLATVGLVKIPGMMTGALIGGSDPAQAARYQLLILLLITACVFLGAAAAVLLTVQRMFDEDHRLRLDRLES